ncbi:hypothetical protein KHP62_03355 [Rhodobacteraceae bacterium NNCM2]|nr:hypothetical protein [Coraliihabitans acroporae]
MPDGHCRLAFQSDGAIAVRNSDQSVNAKNYTSFWLGCPCHVDDKRETHKRNTAYKKDRSDRLDHVILHHFRVAPPKGLEFPDTDYITRRAVI